jgi:hypothetical protein
MDQNTTILMEEEPPIPPEKPDPEECCGSGCERCVVDVYYEKLEQYQGELREWQRRRDARRRGNESP